jgi:flavin reductase (DIM6/NTAB) family NADH-FMN oxidoreductase RutF
VANDPAPLSPDPGGEDGFKAAFRRFPTGVAVVTATGPAGPVGLTASSVASVSVVPPALSFSVMGSPSARIIAAASSFVVHLLGARHSALAQDFARPGGPRFTPEQEWSVLATGEPMLPSALAALRCTPVQLVAVGTSTVVIATVDEVYLGPADGRLVYHDRTFVIPS